MSTTLLVLKGIIPNRIAMFLLAVMFSVLAAPQAQAADPHGNWSEQRDITRANAISHCNNNPNNVNYITSYVWGDNSRSFWYEVRYWNGLSIYGKAEYRISNNNVIWRLLFYYVGDI